MSRYLQEFNAELKILTTKLLKHYCGITENKPNFEEYVYAIMNYINEHSLDYIPRKNDVLKNFDELIEKIELNNQSEKSKLLQNYIQRLETIYENKNVSQKDNLYSFINMIISLAHSPLKTVVNLDYLKEQFENRYLENKYGGYDINKNYYDKMNYVEMIRTVKFQKYIIMKKLRLLVKMKILKIVVSKMKK